MTPTAPSPHAPTQPKPRAAAMDFRAVETSSAWIPAEHFAGALVFFVLGSGGLAFIAADLARGAFFLPRVVAVVHLFVLGWIVLSIFGALCQFLPVAIGRPLRWQALAHVSFAAQVLGVGCFVVGLVSQSRGILHVGAALLAIAFGAFGTNLAATLATAKERSLTWWALLGSTVFLLITPVYGIALALNLHGDVALDNRFTIVAAHAHVAIVGFVLLVMVGVAHRLLPMFLLSHGASERPAWISVISLSAGAALLALPLQGGAHFAVAGGLVAIGVVAFLVQAALFFHHRKRRAVDPGVGLAAVGLVGLCVALLLAPFALTRGLSDVGLLTAYFIVLLGSISLFVSGHFYKIIPFLVWYHRFGPLVGKRKVPKVADLWSEKGALTSGICLAGGWVGLIAAAWLGIGWLAQVASYGFIAGALVQLVVIVQVARRRAS